ncbi:pickpocket protein 28 [Bactrocera oleae]|uniref:pickpocket protein 28 n=1 Tax=Bactrocera oleae TaxID=104688 RepID=UPI00387E232E
MDSSLRVQYLRAKHATLKRYDINRKVIQKRKLKKIKYILFDNFKEYCENTSIHGLKYIVNKSLYPLERLFFAISFICVVYGAAVFVGKIYEKWNYSPMLVSINPKYTKITDDPFPAVTICNLNQAYKAKVQQFSIDSSEYTKIQMLCKGDVNITISNAITDWNNLTYFIHEISQPCSNMLLKCKYAGIIFNCTEIFRPLITDNGLCCTFNMIDPMFMFRNFNSKSFANVNYHYPEGYVPVHWSSEAGYPNDLPEKFIPMKSVGTGESVGLGLILDAESEEYYCSSSDSIGFKILLHNPLEVPNMHEIGLLLSPGLETKIRIQPEKVESETYLRFISKNARKCLFENEERLEMYTEYTQRNCGIECSAAVILENCGCLPHYVPKFFGNETTCSMSMYNCVESTRLETMLIDNTRRDCSDVCMPSCNDLSYMPTFFSAPLIHSGFQNDKFAKNISNTYLEKNIAVVNIYFKDTIYRSQKNSDLIGITDFLSNIGGIISLFFGFSFISLAELIFFAFLRPLRVIFNKLRWRITKSTKLQKPTSIQLLLKKKSKYLCGNLEQIPSVTQSTIRKGNAWQVVLGKKRLLGCGPKTSEPWQPGMEYTP